MLTVQPAEICGSGFTLVFCGVLGYSQGDVKEHTVSLYRMMHSRGDSKESASKKDNDCARCWETEPFRKLKAELSKNSNQSAVPSTLAISVSPLTLGRAERLVVAFEKESEW